MRFVRKWIEDSRGRAIARFLVEEEDSAYGFDLNGFNLGPNTLTFGPTFEDIDVWLRWHQGGIHYFRDGIDQGELGSGGGGAAAWLDLTDTPGSYATFAGWSPRVNEAEDGLEFSLAESGILVAPYRFETDTGGGDPGDGRVAINTVDPNTATWLYISNLGDDDLSYEAWQALRPGDAIALNDANSPKRWIFTVTGESINEAGWDEIPVQIRLADGTFAQNERLTVTAVFLGANEFTDLQDTPDDYAGSGGFGLFVDPLEAGVVFREVSEVPFGQRGDLIYNNGFGWQRLIGGGANQILRMQPLVGIPQWTVNSPDWGNIQNVPATFPPGPHTHDWGDIVSGVPTEFPPAAHVHDWVDITTGVPATFPPDPHTHVLADITDLDDLTFIGLADTPPDYGDGGALPGWVLAQNANGDGLVFIDLGAGGGGDLPPGTRVNQLLRWNGASWVTTNRPGATNDWYEFIDADGTVASTGQFRVGTAFQIAARNQDNSGNVNMLRYRAHPTEPGWDQIQFGAGPVSELLLSGQATRFVGSQMAFFNGTLTTQPDGVTAREAIEALNLGTNIIAEDAGAVDWDDVLNKPTEFPPSAHTHVWADITDPPAEFPPSAHVHDWADITTGVPAEFPPSAHTHVYADITDPPSIPATILDLTDTPAIYGDVGNLLAVAADNVSLEWIENPPTDWNSITGKPATFPPSPHNHVVADITDWPSEFPPVYHTHVVADITDWPAEFPPEAHTHVVADITDWPATFPPAAHTLGSHSDVDTTGATDQQILTFVGGVWVPQNAPSGGQVEWDDVVNKPATFPPSAHTHLLADITDFDGSWDAITGKPATFPPSPHTHVVGDITDFPALVETFLDLSDTPSAYGSVGDVVSIAAGGASLEFTTLQLPSTGFTFSYNQSGPAGVGEFTFDSADPLLAFTSTINEISGGGLYIGTYLSVIRQDDWVLIAGVTAAEGLAFVADGPAVDNGDGTWTVPIQAGTATGSITDANSYRFNVQRPATSTVEWDDVLNKPATFPPSAHTHVVADITDWPAEFPPAAHTHLLADITDFGGTWDEITGKPTEFPPTAHTHVVADITDWPASFPPAAHTHVVAEITDWPATFPPAPHTHVLADITDFDGTVDWGDVTGKPATFPPAAHTHPFTEVTGTIADGQVPATAVTQHQAALSIAWGQLTGVPATFPPSAHTHTISEITDWPTAFPPTAHTHDWSEIATGVPATFPPSPHTHTLAEIVDPNGDLIAHRLIMGNTGPGGTFSGLFSSEAASWPNAIAGATNYFGSSGGTGARVGFSDGTGGSLQVSFFDDEEEGVAETPVDYAMQEIFFLQDAVATLKQALLDAGIPVPTTYPTDAYAVHTGRPRPAPRQPGLTP